MCRILALSCLLVALPACRENDLARPDVPTVETAAGKALHPASGGELLLIPGGQFTMGDANGRPDETPHVVRLTSFYMDKCCVSQQLYEKVMGVNPSKRKDPDSPVERVPWTMAAQFCNQCSEMDGLTPCYDPAAWQCNFSANGYRLPTEAEWEYACRAGNDGKYSFGDDETQLPRYAWVKPHSRGRTWPVGKKTPNRWGLHDMHGNVWEWCNDFYGENYYEDSRRDGPPQDPRGPATGQQRVLRGGAWDSNPDKCRAAYRFQEFPVFTDACFGADSYGLRRVRSADAAAGGEAAIAQARDVKAPKEAEAPVAKSTSGQRPATSADAAADSKAGVAQAHDAKAPQEAAAPVAKSIPEKTPQTEKTTAPVAKPVAKPETAPAAVLEGKIDPSRLKGAIVFASDRGGQLDIWKMRANGAKPEQLTRDPYPDANPRFSPDGKQILYTSLRQGFPEIWLMARDGSQPRRIAEGAQAAWSPDGKSILFIRDDRGYVRQLGSGKEQCVTPDSWQRCGAPAWSPDGQRLAVASRHLQDIGIFILSPDGKEHRQLPTEEPSCTPHWSSDGKRMVFQTVRGHVHQLQLEDQTEEQVTYGADIQHDARYSPDGSMIVFCRAPTAEGPWQICIADLESDDLDVVQITSEGSNSLPDWHLSEDQ